MESLDLRAARWPVAGVAVTLLVVLATWQENQLRLPYENALPTIAAAALIAAVATAVFRFGTGSWTRAGVAGGLVAAYMFYVPAIVSLFRLAYPLAAGLHLLAAALLFLAYKLLPREPLREAMVTGRINLLLLFLLAITTVSLAVKQVRLEADRGQAIAGLGKLEGKSTKQSPDVWHIILDRYAAPSTLKARYGFDNIQFVDALRQRGFTVQEPAWSNYQRTAHSVASTMNGTLLDGLAARMPTKSADWVPIYRAMHDNAAIRRFNAMGYHTVFAGSWWEPTRISSEAAESLQIRTMPQLARTVLDNSSIGFWLGRLSLPTSSFRTHRSCSMPTGAAERSGRLPNRRATRIILAKCVSPIAR
jgi:hypothetical protein